MVVKRRRGFKSKFPHRHKGRLQKHQKRKIKIPNEEPEELKRAPHSFVIHRGTVGKFVLELEQDFRKVMHPFTASSLQVHKKNTLKDFVSIAGPLKVSHLVMFTNSVIGPYMRIARIPRGPTLMFRIHNYSLAKDVLSSLKKQNINKKLFTNSPLVILNNFTGDGMHIKLMASIFQNMFPTINVTNVKLADIRRCIVLNYNPSTKMIDFRHYAIRVTPVGISKGVKKIIQSKVPNLARYDDISDFLKKPSMLSESEAEDDPNSHVEVPQSLPFRGNIISQTSAIRLSELGPRLTLQLLKVEDGLMDGEVIFHETVHKTEEEKEQIRKRIIKKRKIKEQRKREQEDNVKRKEEQKEVNKMKSLEGMQRKCKLSNAENGDEDDDTNYFRQEVGEEPDEDIFRKSDTNAHKESGFIPRWKKKKMDKIHTDDRDENRSFKKRNYNDRDENRPFKKRNYNDRDENRPFKKRNYNARDENRSFKNGNSNNRTENRPFKKKLHQKHRITSKLKEKLHGKGMRRTNRKSNTKRF